MELTNCKIIDGATFENLIISGVNRLKRQVDVVNDLNVFPIPDGDTGDNMLSTISGGIAAMRRVEDNSVGKKAKALSSEMLLHARGNSGVIFSQFFYGLSLGLEGLDTADVSQIISALESGVQKGYSAVVKPVEGTMLTVAREAVEKSAKAVNGDTDLLSFANGYVSEMKESLKRTPELLYVLKEAGVVDSGGAGLLCMAEGIKDALTGNGDVEYSEVAATSTKEVDLDKFTENDVMKFGYCTEFLLRLQKSKVDTDNFDVNEIIKYLETIGDSIVAFKTGTIVKVHVHTLTPYKPLEFCQKFGEFLTVKIENMTLQHNELSDEEKETSFAEEFKVKKARKQYGLCTVASGDGLKDVMKELGADAVIDGGQTKNPSVNDFLSAFDEINADVIFVLPNNSNIFMAAQSAADIYKDSKVYVVPTRNIGQAYSALSMLDYSGDAEEIAKRMESDAQDVCTGMVTVAVRDAEMNGVKIVKGEYVGLTDKTMLTCNKDKVAAALDLIKKLDGENKILVTAVYGNGATAEDRARLSKGVKQNFPDLEMYEIDGGQEVYDFILIIE
ncbi:MAG: DAK2 domain-containing protein [Clostridia bacterium]|nr:DAK2 domain-containing protein [Clostridia bacterium]